MYLLLRKILFLFSPEAAHYFSMNVLKAVCSVNVFKKIIGNYFKPADNLKKELFFASANSSILFSNPVGLGAGFDKNAKYLSALETLGFGFVEIGTVTPKPQPGNDKPRLFRLPADKALINRMGFNNDGAEAIDKKLLAWKNKTSIK
jgi:dihydroorotate dehydrogenase